MLAARLLSGKRLSRGLGSLSAAPVDDLVRAIQATGSSRASFIRDERSGALEASHPSLDGVAAWLSGAEGNIDALGHEAVFLEVGKESGLLMGAFLWNTTRGPGCGGIRFVPYDSAAAYLRDGLRLSTGMGRKSALAGLWWGGGKGVIARPAAGAPTGAARTALFREYGDFLSSLRGCYVAAEDSGVCVSDVDDVFSRTRHTTCISPALGGSGNPSVPTAMGVAVAIRAALEWAGGSAEGASVAIQGLGNVGAPLVGFLRDMGVSRIVGSDIDGEAVARVRAAFPDGGVEVRHTERGDNSVLYEHVDVVAPCALGGLFDARGPPLNCRIVCGAANNQLVDPDDDSFFTDRGILYVPDFVANRMGIVNCANEQYGQVGADRMQDPAVAQHFDPQADNSVHQIVQRVLSLARDRAITPGTAANELAEEMLRQPHPIFPGRVGEIVRALGEEGWARG